MPGNPATACHYHGACLQTIGFPVASVSHPNETRPSGIRPRVFSVFHANHSGSEPNADGILFPIERGKVEATAAHSLKCTRTRNRVINQGLHKVPCQPGHTPGRHVHAGFPVTVLGRAPTEVSVGRYDVGS